VLTALAGELERVRAELEEDVGREEEGVVSVLELSGYFQEQGRDDRVSVAGRRGTLPPFFWY